MSRFKHIIFGISLAALFAGCNESTAFEEPVKTVPPKAIGFSDVQGLPGGNPGSRASASGMFAEGDKIIVSATYTDNPADDTEFTSNFMYKQIVNFDGTKWTYSPIKYWPANGKLTFRGYYPSDVKFNTDPYNGKIRHTHNCKTGFEPLYTVEAVVNANNGELEGAVNDEDQLSLGFTPLLNKVNFTASTENGLFDEVTADEYTNCRFLIINFSMWGFNTKSTYDMDKDTWTSSRNSSFHYLKTTRLNLTPHLAKQKVADVVPGYVYNPEEGYCTEYAVVINEGDSKINIFNKALHLIPRDYYCKSVKQLSKQSPGFEIQYVVLTNKTDSEGNHYYKESGIITREIDLESIFNDEGISKTGDYHLIKKLININLDFSIDAVTVTRDLEDYHYKPMF